MKTLIFADVHLKAGPSGEETLKDFTDFLRQIDPDEFDRAIILGDLFDFWFEYKHVIFSVYFDVLRAFADLQERGMTFHLVCGNHDFWAGRFLEDYIGFTVHRDRYSCRLGDRRALFVHGDGTNPSDRGYRLFKFLARSPLAIGLFRLLHPDWAMGLAQKVSHASRRLKSPDNPSQSAEVKAMREFAKNLLESGEANVVFCGHTHYAVEEEIPTPDGTGLYVNTGDWMLHRTYLEWDGNEYCRKFFGLENASDSAKSLHEEQ